MIKFLSNIPIFRRLFIAFAIAAAIPAVIIVLLGNFYLTSLNQRGQAVSTSFDSQRIASQQQTNLQTMHALLEASQAQVINTLSSSLMELYKTLR